MKGHMEKDGFHPHRVGKGVSFKDREPFEVKTEGVKVTQRQLAQMQRDAGFRGKRYKLDDDSFVVLWDVALRPHGKYDPLWHINSSGSPAEIMKPEKSYEIIKQLEDQGMVKLTPTGDRMDYSKGDPDPTYYAQLTPKGLEVYNNQKEQGRTKSMPKVNLVMKYHTEYGLMKPDERLQILADMAKTGVDKEYGRDIAMTTKYLKREKIISRSGKILDKEKGMEWLK